MRIRSPWFMWAEVAVAVVVMVIEILNKQERGRS